jgi:hypothetical protein
MTDLIEVARVGGRTEPTSTAWAAHFLGLPDTDVDMTARGYVAPMVLCMSARHDLAVRCLERIARLGHAHDNYWGQGGEALLRGALRYASGDVRGAAAQWRALVADRSPHIVRVLPTDVFERAGQPELAARLDARKMAYTYIAGVSEAAPREAKRAFASGDRAKGEELAKKIIQAWENADLQVPAVAEMKRLIQPSR